MEHLWAPWRMRYIESAGSTTGCIFCDKSAAATDEENLILYRGPHAFIILNAFPYSNGHLMVSPFQHTGSMDSLADEELLDLMHLTRMSIRILTKAYRPDGFNVGANLGRAAGAGIADHLHMHVVPRWNGDTNFMSVLADARVVPAALQASRKQLIEVIESGEF